MISFITRWYHFITRWYHPVISPPSGITRWYHFITRWYHFITRWYHFVTKWYQFIICYAGYVLPFWILISWEKSRLDACWTKYGMWSTSFWAGVPGFLIFSSGSRSGRSWHYFYINLLSSNFVTKLFFNIYCTMTGATQELNSSYFINRIKVATVSMSIAIILHGNLWRHNWLNKYCFDLKSLVCHVNLIPSQHPAYKRSLDL